MSNDNTTIEEIMEKKDKFEGIKRAWYKFSLNKVSIVGLGILIIIIFLMINYNLNLH